MRAVNEDPRRSPAGWAFEEPRYIAAAEEAAEFVRHTFWHEGRPRRDYRNGVAEAGGYLDDYAFLGRSYLALHETTFEPRQLEEAVHLAREIDRLFSQSGGGFALQGADAEELIAPVIDIHDGATPSGNSPAERPIRRQERSGGRSGAVTCRTRCGSRARWMERR